MLGRCFSFRASLGNMTRLESSTNTLLEQLRSGGPLARLFQQASGELQAAAQQWLTVAAQQCDHSKWLGNIAQQTQQRSQAGAEASPLVVLRQCEAGCNACCHTVSADVTPLEALIVADHLHRQADAPQLARLRARLLLNVALRANMTAEDRDRTRLRCGLLGDDGLCSVYAARPLVCAGVFSLSRSACQQSAQHADLAEQQVPLDRPAKAWTMGLSGGLQRALVDAGLDGNLYELNSIVLVALDTPNATQRWLAKEDIFAAAVCTDAHSWPRVAKQDPIRVDARHSAVPSPISLKQRRKTRAKLLKRKR